MREDGGGAWGIDRPLVVPGFNWRFLVAAGDLSGDSASDWIVFSTFPGFAYLLTDLQALTPRVRPLLDLNGLNMERPPSSYSREECLLRYFSGTGIVPVRDIDGDRRDNLVVIDSTPCRDVPWKLTRFQLNGDVLRVERQVLALPNRLLHSDLFVGTGITAPGGVEVFSLGDSRSLSTRLRTMRVWRIDSRTQRLEPL